MAKKGGIREEWQPGLAFALMRENDWIKSEYKTAYLPD
jgi:hypothetical protein